MTEDANEQAKRSHYTSSEDSLRAARDYVLTLLSSTEQVDDDLWAGAVEGKQATQSILREFVQAVDILRQHLDSDSQEFTREFLDNLLVATRSVGGGINFHKPSESVADLVMGVRAFVRLAVVWTDPPKSVSLMEPVAFEMELNLSRLRALEKTSEAVTLLEDIRQVAEDVKQVAGEASEVSLSADFAKFAHVEFRQANIFRYLTIATLAAAFGIALYLAFHQDVFKWSEVLIKAIVDIPVLAAAYYFSSEARDHRANGRRASEWQVRLNTIRAYTAELPEEARWRIRTEMGLAVFKEPAQLSTAETLAGVNGQLIAQIVEVIKATKKTD